MVFHPEGGASAHPRRNGCKVGLEARRHRDVADVAAAGADQVVVMLGEIFGQFVASELVARDDAMHNAGTLQDREVPVHRTLRKLGPPLEELRNAERLLGIPEDVDKGAAPRRVALVVGAKPLGRNGVKVGRVEVIHHRRILTVLRTNENPGVEFDIHSQFG
jgi:hypothetical protein